MASEITAADVGSGRRNVLAELGKRVPTSFYVLATYFAFRWIDRIGRRKLAIGGYAGMAVAALIAAPGLLVMTGTTRIVVVMIAL